MKMASPLPMTKSRPKELMQSKLCFWLLLLIIIKHSTLGLVTNTGVDPEIRDLATLGSYRYLPALSIKTRVDMISLIALLRQI